jgi:nitrite reductase (NADH) small subunit
MISPADAAQIEWVAIGELSDFRRRAARIVKAPGCDVAVFRTESGELFALDNRCPHRGGPLSEGIVYGDAVACPLHGWVISLRTGRAAEPDEGCVRTMPVRVESGRVLLGRLAVRTKAA